MNQVLDTTVAELEATPTPHTKKYILTTSFSVAMFFLRTVRLTFFIHIWLLLHKPLQHSTQLHHLRTLYR
ncbi:hypothetical protein HanXRQr2_Chr07g0312001 [Helianthus annuus]|uniref:Uncharacterized protein n=1 Tax=Helianthus annuus TaxID=4232 RepID=A0A9K3NH58_HELAN|nr:hypothetical protein HanXRQr2_Chr07g0312001 [Helianthus annuus]KAJ0906121.1 hypothetical protein HanPSC8_Chr07g0301891 [Helianthus annuus]